MTEGKVMATPEGGWLGLMVEIARQANSEDEFDAELVKALE